MSARSTTVPHLDESSVDDYLSRLGLSRDRITPLGGEALDVLCLAHLSTIPFENLDQVFAGGTAHDLDAAVAKILAGRGGWCFELNGAFGRLLATLGFDVLFIGCAVLLDGPSRRIEHLALEVSGGADRLVPHFVDVGFGDSTVFPLELNRAGPQPGGNGDYEFLASPEGTTLAKHVDGVPEARLRFKRVALDFAVFEPEARRLQTDPSLSWSTTPFATRLVEPDERLTLRHDAFTRTAGDEVTTEDVHAHDRWDDLLRHWFALERPGPWPDAT